MARLGIDISHSEATDNFLRAQDDSYKPISKSGTHLIQRESLMTHTTVDRAQASPFKKNEPVRLHDKISATDTLRVQKKILSLPPNTPQRYMKDIPALERYLAYLAKEEDPLPKQKRAVIIITNHRSGSSFFGELFNQHPDAFYLFEPLFPLSNSSQCELRRNMKMKILQEFVQCSLPDWTPVYKDISVKELFARRRNLRACRTNGMCFRPNTKELCEDTHCPRTSHESVKSCFDECGAINRRLVENVCRRKSLVALKVIRVCDIRDMEEIVSALPVDIKILHLLRDPRGIANSRRHVLRTMNVNASLHDTCHRLKQNMLTGLVDTPAWLKGRYMVVRYEDVALHPYGIAQSVYSFVGLSFPKNMLQWIANNTGIPNPQTTDLFTSPINHSELNDIKSWQNRAAEQQSENLLQLKKRRDPYGTTRDSAKVVQKWVSQLPYRTVRLVEDVCTTFMEMAGYIAVGDQESYIRNKSTKYSLNDIPLQMKLN